MTLTHCSAYHIRFIFFALILAVSYSLQAQWVEFKDETSNRLNLTTVANADDEEKDIITGDLNKDGMIDMIVVRKEPFSNPTEPAKSDLLLMNVNGVLEDQTSLYAPEFLTNVSFARDVLIADLDDDGWDDVVIANTFNQQPIYYKNKGNNNLGEWLGLEDESSLHFPNLTGDNILFCAVWAEDVTGDDALDLYFVNYKQFGGAAKDFLLINDGSGVFTDESATRLGNLRNSAFGTAVEIFDMDNDGDNDILKTSVLFDVSPWNGQGLFLLFNDGTGNFSNYQKVSIQVPGAETDSPYMFRVADYNMDGKKDIFVVDDLQDYQLIATTLNPNTSIVYSSNIMSSNRTSFFGGNIHSADLDNDGDLDVGVSDVDVDIPPCNSDRSFALFENVNGLFQDPYTTAVAWDGNTYDYAFIDINNDGLEDFVQGNCNGYKIFMNESCDLVSGSADYDMDGINDACDDCPTNPDPNCIEIPDYPVVDTNLNIARQWNEMLLASIRRDLARPTVHARNLFHLSIAMWDVWSVFEPNTCTYLLGKSVDGFACSFNGVPTPTDVVATRHEAISYAAYRILSHRFASSPDAIDLQVAYDNHMVTLGYDINLNDVDYSTGNAYALGNYIAQCIIDFGLQDGSNEQNAFANTSYTPVNNELIIVNSGNPDITDLNRWQPLTLDLFIDQSGNVIPGATPDFLSPEWGQVSAFALGPWDLNTQQRGGFDYKLYHDPGAPVQHAMDGSGTTEDYQWNFTTTLIWSSHLDATDGSMIDISPGVVGKSTALPTDVSGYASFYNQINGGTSSNGHVSNPATGLPYTSNVVPRGDFARVLAEFWADGPDSETPPGHWFTLLNEVSDHPDFEKKYEGIGPVLEDTEWYVKAYLAMGGAMHDAAVSAWGVKGWYDYLRPISAIRAMADLGQSSEPLSPNYHPGGLPLMLGYIELTASNDPLVGVNNENLNKIKVKAWRGHKVINNIDTDEAGVDWILAEDWVPYQRPSFVTPPFAGYVSGHSTFSRAAAEVMTLLTGNEFFPGGMGTFTAVKDEFLVFEDGPSIDLELQWATYRDAADQSALSRIWGGIHPPTDDIPGRIMGIRIGQNAYGKAKSYYSDSDQNNVTDACEDCVDRKNISVTHMAFDYFHWEANKNIIADNIIMNGATIIYDAGEAVLLEINFEVEKGAIFNAFIDGCN